MHIETIGGKRRHVRVEGRDEVGEVIVNGKQLSNEPEHRAVMVLFPSTGECAYYLQSRVKYVE